MPVGAQAPHAKYVSSLAASPHGGNPAGDARGLADARAELKIDGRRPVACAVNLALHRRPTDAGHVGFDRVEISVLLQVLDDESVRPLKRDWSAIDHGAREHLAPRDDRGRVWRVQHRAQGVLAALRAQNVETGRQQQSLERVGKRHIGSAVLRAPQPGLKLRSGLGRHDRVAPRDGDVDDVVQVPFCDIHLPAAEQARPRQEIEDLNRAVVRPKPITVVRRVRAKPRVERRPATHDHVTRRIPRRKDFRMVRVIIAGRRGHPFNQGLPIAPRRRKPVVRECRIAGRQNGL